MRGGMALPSYMVVACRLGAPVGIATAALAVVAKRFASMELHRGESMVNIDDGSFGQGGSCQSNGD